MPWAEYSLSLTQWPALTCFALHLIGGKARKMQIEYGISSSVKLIEMKQKLKKNKKQKTTKRQCEEFGMPATISCAPLLRCSQTLSVTCAETEDSGRILHPNPSAKVFLSAQKKKKNRWRKALLEPARGGRWSTDARRQPILPLWLIHPSKVWTVRGGGESVCVGLVFVCGLLGCWGLPEF